jgi:signal transduction histidine kinase
MLDEQRLRRVLEVGSTVVSELDLEAVLQRVLDEARELTGARYAALGVLDQTERELERFLTVGASPAMHRAIGDLPRGRGVLGVLITEPHPLRLHQVSDHPRSFGFPPGHPPMGSFLGVPVVIRGRPWGNLYLTDKQGADDFDDDDEEAIVLLASWAAIAIDNAHSAANASLRRSLQASERERQRWARELHDETLQQLAGLKVLLAAARRRGPDRLDDAVATAIAQLDASIGDLRRLITDLRPAALDDLGLRAALEGLIDRVAETGGLRTTLRVDVGERRPPSEIEDAAYRIVQEALTNVVKHAGASRVEVEVVESGERLTLTIADDGIGIADDPRVPRIPTSAGSGFGLIGMRERVELVGGRLLVQPGPRGGTQVQAVLPTGVTTDA